MPHWSDKYLGEAYVKREADCAAFVVRVAREVFGREVLLPRPDSDDYRALARAVEAGKSSVAVPTDAPADGDSVLMRGRGYINHIGVFTLFNGEPWVVHAFIRCGSVARHRIINLASVGLAVEGYYRWK